jgi:hypothetical protein
MEFSKDKILGTQKPIELWLKVGILLIPPFFAWFTLQKGRSTLSKALAFGWMAVWIIYMTAGSNNNELKTQNTLATASNPYGFMNFDLGSLRSGFEGYNFSFSSTDTRPATNDLIINEFRINNGGDNRAGLRVYASGSSLNSKVSFMKLSIVNLEHDPAFDLLVSILRNKYIFTDNEKITSEVAQQIRKARESGKKENKTYFYDDKEIRVDVSPPSSLYMFIGNEAALTQSLSDEP